MLGLHPRSTNFAGRAGVPPAAAHARFVCQLNLSGLARDPYETNWQSPPAPLSLSCECVDCELCGHRTATGTAHTADRASGGRARGSVARRPTAVSRVSLATARPRGRTREPRLPDIQCTSKQEKAEAHKTVQYLTYTLS